MKNVERAAKMPVMGHLVLGYPSLAESIRTAGLYADAGIAILELQIPFSHPTADGPVITAACQEAVENQHVSMTDCMVAIRSIRESYPEQEIMVMSYINRVFAYGMEKFRREMNALGIRHLIIPDLPVDFPGFADFKNQGDQSPKLVPVLAANVSDARIEKLLAMGFDFFYLMADFKITGSTFSLHPRLQEVIAKINPLDTKQETLSTRRIGIGFGISSPEQALLVTQTADVAIIGSAL
ncbi:MAG: tryptophan synthase subunit alpha, partial [Saprospiraceae bacterium]